MNQLRVWLAYHIMPKNTRKYLIKALSDNIKELEREITDMIEQNIEPDNSGNYVVQEPRWIPVGERLPKLYEEVIVTDIETSDTYLSRYIGNGYWECDNGTFNNRIIAWWQPKPKPYKAES